MRPPLLSFPRSPLLSVTSTRNLPGFPSVLAWLACLRTCTRRVWRSIFAVGGKRGTIFLPSLLPPPPLIISTLPPPPPPRLERLWQPLPKKRGEGERKIMVVIAYVACGWWRERKGGGEHEKEAVFFRIRPHFTRREICRRF